MTDEEIDALLEKEAEEEYLNGTGTLQAPHDWNGQVLGADRDDD